MALVGIQSVKNSLFCPPLKHLHPSSVLTSFPQLCLHFWISLSIAVSGTIQLAANSKQALPTLAWYSIPTPTHFHVLILLSLLSAGHPLPRPQDPFYSPSWLLNLILLQENALSIIGEMERREDWARILLPSTACCPFFTGLPGSSKPATFQVMSFIGLTLACTSELSLVVTHELKATRDLDLKEKKKKGRKKKRKWWQRHFNLCCTGFM